MLQCFTVRAFNPAHKYYSIGSVMSSLDRRQFHTTIVVFLTHLKIVYHSPDDGPVPNKQCSEPYVVPYWLVDGDSPNIVIIPNTY